MYTAITRVPSSSTSARMKSAIPSATSLPQLMVTRKPSPNSCARACAMTPMPPLWLTIETTPGVRWSCSASIELNDAVNPSDETITRYRFSGGIVSISAANRACASRSTGRCLTRVLAGSEPR